MTLICPFNFIKRSDVIHVIMKSHMNRYMYFIQTSIILSTIYETQPLERSVTLI